jgi:hypothetical protein
MVANMLSISYGLRDERINIMAMTYGTLPGKYPYQIIICKKNIFPADKIGPFLLIPKVTQGQYQRSIVGIHYEESFAEVLYENNFAAIVDSFIRIKVCYSLFDSLLKEGLFTLWDPSSPVNYYNGAKEGYLTVFRVYKLANSVSESLFARGVRGRNFYFKLDEEILVNTISPVLSDSAFSSLKSHLIDTISREQALISVD